MPKLYNLNKIYWAGINLTVRYNIKFKQTAK